MLQKEGIGSSEANGELGDPKHTASHHMALSSSTHQDSLSVRQPIIFSFTFPKESNTLRPYGQELTLRSEQCGKEAGTGGSCRCRYKTFVKVETRTLQCRGKSDKAVRIVDMRFEFVCMSEKNYNTTKRSRKESD